MQIRGHKWQIILIFDVSDFKGKNKKNYEGTGRDRSPDAAVVNHVRCRLSYRDNHVTLANVCHI